MSTIRLDEWLVANGHYASRARARDAILRGCVYLGGTIADKPSRSVQPTSEVSIDDPAQAYVSRAALKLVHALKTTGYSPRGKISLDIGASTGGFCQVLLKEGASRVFAVDVGHNQLAEPLRHEERLTNLENLNARDLTLNHLDGIQPELITCDASFISLKLVLPPALELAAEGAAGIFLIKPQFEVGKDRLGKGGIVREEGLAKAVAEEISEWLDGHANWRVTHFLPSPISGGDGNHEFLLAGTKS